MSLSQRFGQADEKRRSGGQNNKNVTVKIDASAASPKGAKNGMKKSNSGAQPQKGGKKAQGNPKNAKPVKKAGPKPVQPKKKSAEEMDLELDTYMIGKDKAMSARLDAEMDAYRSARAREAELAPDS